MSAGGLSYDCLTTSRKTTLPSVEMWGTNMNILRDPPASLYTRRIDKVGDTQQVLLAQEAGGDRISEFINVYARGVNPMVSVSYDNYGNNAGARSSLVGAGRAVKLPYKPEVFRPPVFRQEDITPLSRLPREWFYALSNPEMPNIVNQMECHQPVKNAVWQNKSVIRPPVQVQYNTEDITTDCSLSLTNKNIHAQVLQGDRLTTSEPRYERQVWLHNASDPTQVHHEQLRGSAMSSREMPSFGTDRDIIKSFDHKSVNHNKLLYKVLSNTSGNKNVANARDMVKTIQQHALHMDPLPVSSVSDSISLNHIGQADGSSRGDLGSVRHKLKDYLTQLETGTQVSGMYFKDDLRGGDTPDKGAGNKYPYKQVLSKPSNDISVMPSDMSMSDPSNLRSVHDNTMTIDYVSNKAQPDRRKVIEHSALGSGKIENDLRTIQVESNKAVPSSGQSSDTFKNIALSVRNNMNHSSVTSPMSQDRTSLQNIMYNDTHMPTSQHNLPVHEAYTSKTSFDKTSWMGDKVLRPLQTIETSTHRDVRATGHHVYDVHSTDARDLVSHGPSAGSFDPKPNAIPMLHRQENGYGEMPIDHKNMSVKNKASRDFFERHEDPFRNTNRH